MMSKMLVALLVLATTARAEVCRPSGADLTIAIPAGAYFANDHGRTANQHTRACHETAATWDLVSDIFTWHDHLPDWVKRAESALGLSTGTTRIEQIPPYRGALQFPRGGIWDYAHHPQGRDYQTAHSSFVSERAAVVTAVKRGDAYVIGVLRSSADLRARLNLADDLVSPLYATNPDDGIALDTVRQNAFPISTLRNLPPCGGGDGCALLDAVDAAHACSATGRPDCPSVASARVAYEAGCGADENCAWFRRLMAFTGLKDPRWSAVERSQWERLTHVFYGKWSAGQRTGDTHAVTFNDARHQQAHLCLAIGTNDALRVTMPADGIPAQAFAESYGGDQPCRSLLPKLVAAYGLAG